MSLFECGLHTGQTCSTSDQFHKWLSIRYWQRARLETQDWFSQQQLRFKLAARGFSSNCNIARVSLISVQAIPGCGMSWSWLGRQSARFVSTGWWGWTGTGFCQPCQLRKACSIALSTARGLKLANLLLSASALLARGSCRSAHLVCLALLGQTCISKSRKSKGLREYFWTSLRVFVRTTAWCLSNARDLSHQSSALSARSWLRAPLCSGYP